MPDPDADPFATVVPIARSPFHPGHATTQPETVEPAQPQPPQFAALSSAEIRYRTKRTRSNRAPTEAPDDAPIATSEETGSEAAPLRGKQSAALTLPEALRRTAVLARKVHRTAMGRATKQADVKHASVAFAVLIDKHLALSGRPASRLREEDADELRPGVLDLARRALGMP